MPDLTPERRAALEREKSKNSSRAGFYDTKNLVDDVIRLLPLGPTEDVGTKYVYYFLNNKSYTCPEETHGQPSVILKAVRALERLGTEEAVEMAAAIKKARRAKWLMKVISRKDPSQPKWFEAPYAIYKVAFEAFDKDGEDLSHPNRGRDLRISKTGSGKNTEYSARIMDQSQLADEKEERQRLRELAAAMDRSAITKTNETGAVEALMATVTPALWKQIKGEVLGGAAGADTAGDAEPVQKKKAVVTDDDDDAPARGAAAEDDDAPAPKKKPVVVDDDAPAPAKRQAAPVADDDDAPAPKKKPAPVADDEEEAPAPKKKAPAPVDDDDADAAPPAKKKPAPVDDDDEAPRPAANKKAPVVVDDEEDAAPPVRKHKVVDDDE